MPHRHSFGVGVRIGLRKRLHLTSPRHVLDDRHFVQAIRLQLLQINLSPPHLSHFGHIAFRSFFESGFVFFGCQSQA